MFVLFSVIEHQWMKVEAAKLIDFRQNFSFLTY